MRSVHVRARAWQRVGRCARIAALSDRPAPDPARDLAICSAPAHGWRVDAYASRRRVGDGARLVGSMRASCRSRRPWPRWMPRILLVRIPAARASPRRFDHGATSGARTMTPHHLRRVSVMTRSRPLTGHGARPGADMDGTGDAWNAAMGQCAAQPDRGGTDVTAAGHGRIARCAPIACPQVLRTPRSPDPHRGSGLRGGQR